MIYISTDVLELKFIQYYVIIIGNLNNTYLFFNIDIKKNDVDFNVSFFNTQMEGSVNKGKNS